MKRALLIGLLAVSIALTAHAWYVHAHRPADPAEPKIAWLVTELALSPEQAAQVRAVHARHIPQLNALHCELEQERTIGPDPAACEEIEDRCARSTERLIVDVSAVLQPVQRTRYHELVQSCLRPPLRTN